MAILMEFRFSLEFASMSDTGQVRSHNEDAIVVCPDTGLAVLADGMGGYNAGEVASSIAISVIQQVVEEQLSLRNNANANASDEIPPPLTEPLLIQAVDAANLAILDASSREPEYRGMGTTVVTALFSDAAVTIAHVGDSRAYRLRDGTLVQITRDHSLLQEQLDAGLITLEQAKFAQHKNLITRAVGVDFVMETETNQFDVVPGDCYLLCSDGLSDMLTDAEIAKIVTGCGNDMNATVRQLVAQANEQGGRDNISVILIRVGEAVR